MIRKGAAKGSGRGYKNLRNYPRDPVIHAESGRGMKQPQRIRRMLVVSHFTKGKDMPVKEVSEVMADLTPQKVAPAQSKVVVTKEVPVTEIREDFLTKVAVKQEKKPSKVVGVASKAGSAAWAFGKEKLREYQASARTKAAEKHEKYIEELRDIEHPVIKKRDKIQSEIEMVETKIAAGVGSEDDHFDRLEVLKAKLEEVEGQIDHLDLSTFTDGQLKALAVRDTGGDDLFSMDTGNKYERELVRRIQYRKELDKKLSEANHPKTKGDGGLFDL
jgi:hypothetical protein